MYYRKTLRPLNTNTLFRRLLPLLLLLLYGEVAPASAWGEVVPPDSSPPPTVRTPLGEYRGQIIYSGRQKRKVYSFTKIPYALPPVDGLRFASPVKVGKHDTPIDATSPSPECLQWDHLRMRGVVGQEDCLYLDIYSNTFPGLGAEARSQQPTVVFLHAGSYLAGGGSIDLFTPDYLIENDVCVVLINTRLGALGFLSTEDEHLPGNYGMRDTIAALEWLRDNLWYFGGMNETLTVMGSGAGGSTAHFLTLSPLARGSSIHVDDMSIVARAISHSGTAYSPHAVSRDAKVQALSLAAGLGCAPGGSSSDLRQCLRSLSAETIVGQTPILFKWDEEPIPFGPVIDSWMGDAAFLPDEPYHIIHQGNVLQAPWIAGTNRDDGAFRVQDILQDSHLVKQLNTEWDRWGPVLLHLSKASCKDPVAISRQIRDYYMKGKPFGDATAKLFVEMMTDRFFVYPTEKAMDDHCTTLKGNRIWCYRYVLDYCGRKSFLDILHHETRHAQTQATFGMSNPRFKNTRDAHGWGVGFMDELLFLFPSPKLKLLYKQIHDTDGATSVSNQMIMFWTNFIKGGDPTPVLEGMPDDQSPWGAWWDPYYTGYDYYLQIDPDMYTQDTPYRRPQKIFWAGLPLFENRDNNVIRDEL